MLELSGRRGLGDVEQAVQRKAGHADCPTGERHEQKHDRHRQISSQMMAWLSFLPPSAWPAAVHSGMPARFRTRIAAICQLWSGSVAIAQATSEPIAAPAVPGAGKTSPAPSPVASQTEGERRWGEGKRSGEAVFIRASITDWR